MVFQELHVNLEIQRAVGLAMEHQHYILAPVGVHVPELLAIRELGILDLIWSLDLSELLLRIEAFVRIRFSFIRHFM